RDRHLPQASGRLIKDLQVPGPHGGLAGDVRLPPGLGLTPQDVRAALDDLRHPRHRATVPRDPTSGEGLQRAVVDTAISLIPPRLTHPRRAGCVAVGHVPGRLHLQVDLPTLLIADELRDLIVSSTEPAGDYLGFDPVRDQPI